MLEAIVGRTRLYQWSPRNPLVPPFRALLEVALDGVAAVRRSDAIERIVVRRGGCCVVSDALTSAGITAALSGGAAVQIYTSGLYESRDLAPLGAP
jgi:hypothetical protein